jgi:sigma-B regulation protein RsbU (phosphoserine phosphatase)
MGADQKVNKLYTKLRLKDFKLNSLLEITKAINNNFPVDKLLNIYEYILREQLGISKLILFNHDEEWSCILKYGVRGRAKNINVSEDLTHIKEITVIESSSKNSLNSFDVVIPVFHKEQPLAYLLIGDLNEDEIKISPTIKHMPFIQTLTNIIVVAIENKRMAKESIRQERAKRELEVASEMQSLLFPSDLPSNNRVDIAGQYQSHQMVGGDYYDYIQLNHEEFVFCMADVSGKGVSAALLMSNFQANLRALISYTDLPLTELVHKLNSRVMASADGEKFITFFIGKYNITNKTLKYINAGHNHPVLTDGKNFQLLGVGCTGLGMFDEIPTVEEETIHIHPKSTIVCYTDGLVELENENEEDYGTDRLVDIIHNNYQLKMEELNTLIFQDLEEFRNTRPYMDDTALFSCRFF